jgi:hypothetical protein
MKKLFDTMPLSGVADGVSRQTGSFKQATVGHLSGLMRFMNALTPFQLVSPRPRLKDPKPGATRIWSYQVPADPAGGPKQGHPAMVTNIGCRVRDQNFNQFLVLDKLEWGSAPIGNPTAFRQSVQVLMDTDANGKNGVQIELPLLERFRLMSFATLGENTGAHPLWPLDLVHDLSILHVFVYEISRGAGALKSLSETEPQKVADLVNRLQRLTGSITDDDEDAETFLFSDDLWDDSAIGQPPAAKAPESVSLCARPLRIIVACSLTVCREKDDYQPGRPASVGRMFPHTMVVSTGKLDRVEAGVRFTRPAKMTLLDGNKCSCDEMLSDIGGLLVTDSNGGGMVVENAPGDAPHIYWANLFNYYVVDPFSDPELRNVAIPLVRNDRPTAREDFGSVVRDCSDIPFGRQDSNATRITKFARQGWFDNIHVAPKMQVKDQIDRISIRNHAAHQKFTNIQDWKMDTVSMAPFCAHDCFHMHWRWSNNGNTESHTYGWGPKLPYQAVGRPMIPENHESFLVITGEAQFSYLERANLVEPQHWEPFCHHGAGYALAVGTKVTMAQLATQILSPVLIETSKSLLADPFFEVMGDWALFYWRARYTVVDNGAGSSPRLSLKERFQFKNKKKALDL